MTLTNKLPLAGIRIIDHGVVYTGTAATTFLADMGAQVIRVESIGRFPAMTRGLVARPPAGLSKALYHGYADYEPGERPWDRWYQLHATNRNKLAIGLELDTPRGAAVYKKLVKISDLVMENFSQGTMDRLGLGYEVLKEVNPGLIMISASGLGKEGPYKGYSTFGTNVDAITGNMALRGYPEDDMTMKDCSPVWADNVAAGTVSFAALVALHYRKKTGNGQFIDISQAENLLPHMGESILEYTMNGRLPPIMGNRDHAMAPHGCYPCRGVNKWVNISISSDAEWQAFGEAIGNPDWVKDARFETVLGRYRHQDELDKLVTAWTLTQDNFSVMHLLQSVGVTAGPVVSPSTVYSDPHLQARGFFKEVTHRETGTHSYPGMFFKFSRTPAEVRLPPPCLGEHNAYVLTELLGISEDEYAALEKDNIIGTEYLPGA
ncbi:MAG: CoA transferase [Dehalococcoidales bacterium]|nr:CoA transferase [Dehalococcoidales bacterium]